MALVVDTGPLLAAGDPGSFDLFLESVGNGEFRVEPMNAEDYARIRVLLRQYADFPLGLSTPR